MDQLHASPSSQDAPVSACVGAAARATPPSVRAKLAAPAINRLIMCFLSGFGFIARKPSADAGRLKRLRGMRLEERQCAIRTPELTVESAPDSAMNRA